ncbi:hypothetical protein PFICI_08019 [Pestalotiopsis fici W106-1]|uniref:Uncharacterized protein n=1 Tax=Pestalotiopsis fici (strain W106-1 / CGMCC3.15140) TaxID=1229662 RepID=W3X333_PESFW|nr:uncharacterized protein PFICI_08019 [Pestalotiopsis fici W106-1]ETS80490.1 hypothetical protein PFICI_08019 [Pestalotiopsis fici W106-1]
MIVYLSSLEQTITVKGMAPSSQMCFGRVDHLSLIVENSQFISNEGAEVSVITIKEVTGEWKAIVLRLNHGVREALLSSDPSESIQKAIESLHLKTAEAAAIYVKNNGFSLLPDPNKDEDDFSDDETVSVVSEQNGSSSDDGLSVSDSSDDELVTPASSSFKGKRSDSKASKKRSKRSKARRPRSYEESEVSDEDVVRAPPARSVGPRCAPPPAPPVYNSSLRPMHPGLAAMQPPQLPRSPVLPPGGMHGVPPHPGMLPHGMRHPGVVRPARVYEPAKPVHDVRITINWLQHGEQRIFESTNASIRALQDAAVLHVRNHMSNFDNVTPMDHSPNRAWNLRAAVKQAFFGAEAYDMSNYRGDDLTKLFSVLGKTDIPSFEIEVDYAVPPHPPVPAGHVIGGPMHNHPATA